MLELFAQLSGKESSLRVPGLPPCTQLVEDDTGSDVLRHWKY